MLKKSLVAVFLAVAPVAAFAYGTPPAPAHGGPIVETPAEHWMELAIKGEWVSSVPNSCNRSQMLQPAAVSATRARCRCTAAIAPSDTANATLDPGSATSPAA